MGALRIRERDFMASSSRPFMINQRGLSGRTASPAARMAAQMIWSPMGIR